MHIKQYPVIDPIATGKNISRLRVERGLTVKQLQAFFGFEEPQAIYRWQWGKSLPSVDNLYALSILFEVSMDEIIVPRGGSIANAELQEKSCSSVFLLFPAAAVPNTAETRFSLGHFCLGVCALLRFSLA